MKKKNTVEGGVATPGFVSLRAAAADHAGRLGPYWCLQAIRPTRAGRLHLCRRNRILCIVQCLLFCSRKEDNLPVNTDSIRALKPGSKLAFVASKLHWKQATSDSVDGSAQMQERSRQVSLDSTWWTSSQTELHSSARVASAPLQAWSTSGTADDRAWMSLRTTPKSPSVESAKQRDNNRPFNPKTNTRASMWFRCRLIRADYYVLWRMTNKGQAWRNDKI